MENASKALKIIQGVFGVDSALVMSEVAQARDAAIPTGIAAFDWGALGIGGMPLGQWVEIYGKEKVGKTSLLLAMMAGFQRAGIVPVAIDPKAATASDNERARRIGVDTDGVIILPIHTSEDALIQTRAIIEKTHKEGIKLAFFWDDMGITATRKQEYKEKEKTVLKETVADKARVMWNFCRTLSGLCYRKKASMVVVNHLIATIARNPAFSGSVTTGGGGVRAAARIRVKLVRMQALKKGSQKIGHIVKAITEANAFADVSGEVLLYFTKKDGYLSRESTMLNAVDGGFVRKSKGPAYKVAGKKGKPKKLDAWTDEEIEDLEVTMWPGDGSSPVADYDDGDEGDDADDAFTEEYDD